MSVDSTADTKGSQTVAPMDKRSVDPKGHSLVAKTGSKMVKQMVATLAEQLVEMMVVL